MQIGIIINERKSRAAASVERLLAEIDLRGDVPLVMEAKDPSDADNIPVERVRPEILRERSDVVVALGGDGTMLAAGRLLAGSGTPMIGVNLGRLGFLAEFDVEEIARTLDEVAANRARIVERRLLDATIEGSSDTIVALNDIVVDKRDTSILVSLEVAVNCDYLGTYTADGLVVATPTGSTGYALSAGGPVVAPNAGVLVIAPIAPHMLTARPVVIADDAVISIRAKVGEYEPESAHIIADGQIDAQLVAGRSLTIRRHPHVVHLVKSESRTYFDVLRAKLLWGGRPTQEDPERPIS